MLKTKVSKMYRIDFIANIKIITHPLRSNVYPTIMGHQSGGKAPLSALWKKHFGTLVSSLRPSSGKFGTFVVIKIIFQIVCC